MKIRSISVSFFRNIESSQLFPNESFNALLGKNGQGKTNFLEALYASICGKSFRSYAKKQDWFPQTSLSSISQVRLSLEDDRAFPLELELRREGLKWFHRLNEKRISALKLRERIPIVAFSPDDHSLLRQGPDKRRNFMDDVYTDICPGYGETLQRYNKALKQRNELIRKIQREEASRQDLSLWDRVLSKACLELYELRGDLWPQLKEELRISLGKLFKEAIQKIEIQWLPYLNEEERKSEETFQKNLLFKQAKDLALGYSSSGAHRDDLRFVLDGQEARSCASQGQARICALGLKMAHVSILRRMRGESPIFLLDDLSSELDEERRRYLIRSVKQMKGQLFLSATDASLVDFKDISEYTQYSVIDGRIEIFLDMSQRPLEIE